MTSVTSGLYAGTVGHTRLRPRRHRLSYRIFMTLLDLDELPALDLGLTLFAVNRPGLLSFYERDHADGAPGALKAKIEAALTAGGLDLGGPIRILCLPRVLSFVFNPISVYFCHRRDGSLGALLYEVSNTFGERHSYLIPTPANDGPIDQRCDKRLFVSPFMGMDMAYRFRIHPPAEAVAMLIDGSDAQGLLITTHFTGHRAELTDRAIAHALLTHPLLTLKVVAGIHWEALKLFAKGVRLVPRPPAPAKPITVVR